MTALPLFAELCAGTAALSLRLHGGKNARPPVSRMGNKQGYASAILRCLGLRSGSGAARYLWCEPDDGCRLLLTSYTDADLRNKAAEIIRSWADQDPRKLWERLRAEGPVKSPPVDPREVARWIRLVTANRLINVGPDFQNTGQGGSTHGGDSFCTSIPELLDALDRVPDHLPASILPDARAVDPREVARWCWVQRRSAHAKGDGYHGGNDTHKISETAPAPALSTLPTLPASILPDARAVDPREVARWIQIVASNELINVGPDWKNTGKGGSTFGGEIGYGADRSLKKLEALPTLPASILPDARAVDPPQLPPGSVVYIDPPYVNTTGYAHDLGRDAVCELAERWASAGAWVVISEAEPLAELGWHQVEITGERVGQKRTFSKQQREYLTMSRPPLWRPSEQRTLFTMAAK